MPLQLSGIGACNGLRTALGGPALAAVLHASFQGVQRSSQCSTDPVGTQENTMFYSIIYSTGHYDVPSGDA